MSDTPVEVQFTSAGCLNYPCRTPVGLHLLHLLLGAVREKFVGLGNRWLIALFFKHGRKDAADELGAFFKVGVRSVI